MITLPAFSPALLLRGNIISACPYVVTNDLGIVIFVTVITRFM